TVSAVNATSSQGSTSAPIAASRIGRAVASDDTRASTHTISPVVRCSAARIAAPIFCCSAAVIAIYQLPDAPPPPDDPPPPEKPPPPPPPLEKPPEEPRELPEESAALTTTLKKNQRKPGDTISRITSAIRPNTMM